MERIKLNNQEKMLLQLNPKQEYYVEISKIPNNIIYLNNMQIELKEEESIDKKTRGNIAKFILISIVIYLIIIFISKDI